MKLLQAKRLEARVTEDEDGTTRIRILNPNDKNDGCYVYEVEGRENVGPEATWRRPEPKSERIGKTGSPLAGTEQVCDHRSIPSFDFIPMDPDLPEKMFGDAPTGIDPWGNQDGRTMFESAMNYESGRLFKELKTR